MHGRGRLVHVPWGFGRLNCPPVDQTEPHLTVTHYTRTAVGLHWTIAALVLTAVFMGWTMTSMDVSPLRLKVYNWHKWVGVTVLALALLRLFWRLTHRAPPLVASLPAWQRVGAHAGHALLYGLMLVMPVTGWIYSNYSGYPVVYLGKVPLPNLVERDRELAATWLDVHVTLSVILVVTVGVHVVAALYHQFIARDGTLRRMLTWRAAAR
jgi:cytochrome b561